MTINELKEKITLPFADFGGDFFIFYGSEWKVQSIYINKIAEVTNSDIQYINSIKDIFDDSGSSLFAASKCYVGVDIPEILKSDNLEKDVEKILQILGSNTLILQFTKLDKRSKLYNFAQGICGVEFEPLHPIVLEKHILDEIELSSDLIKQLIHICESDYGKILFEIDKIKRYAECKGISHIDAFNELLDHKIIYQPPEDKIFEFSDAVLGGKPKAAFRLLQECKEIGEPSLKLLSVLFTNFKHLLQVQSCKGSIAETTGLMNWEIRNVQKFENVYKISELVYAIRLIRNTEKGIKTGQIDEQMAVDFVLVSIF